MKSTHEQREYEQAPDTLYRTQKSDMLNMIFQNVFIFRRHLYYQGKKISQYGHISSPVILCFKVKILTFFYAPFPWNHGRSCESVAIKLILTRRKTETSKKFFVFEWPQRNEWSTLLFTT